MAEPLSEDDKRLVADLREAAETIMMAAEAGIEEGLFFDEEADGDVDIAARLEAHAVRIEGTLVHAAPVCTGSRMEVVPGRATALWCPECRQLLKVQPYEHPDGTTRHMLPEHEAKANEET